MPPESTCIREKAIAGVRGSYECKEKSCNFAYGSNGKSKVAEEIANRVCILKEK